MHIGTEVRNFRVLLIRVRFLRQPNYAWQFYMKNVNEINFLLHEMIDLNLYKIDEITLKLGV